MTKLKFLIVANPNSNEETAELQSDDVLRIEVNGDGQLTIFTTDDSACAYLEDEWLRLELIRD